MDVSSLVDVGVEWNICSRVFNDGSLGIANMEVTCRRTRKHLHLVVTDGHSISFYFLCMHHKQVRELAELLVERISVVVKGKKEAAIVWVYIIF